MKTIKQEVPITRSRFVHCPQCKTRGLKLKRIIQVGRCRTCHESYRVVTQHVKTENRHRQPMNPEFKGPGSGLPAWQGSSDSSPIGSGGQTSFGGRAFGCGRSGQGSKRETGSDR